MKHIALVKCALVVAAAGVMSVMAQSQTAPPVDSQEKSAYEAMNPFLKKPTPRRPRPTVPYENPGACPFECCTYRDWTVERDTDVFRDYRGKTPVAFRVRRGEKVVALTGVVVTTKLGVALATERILMRPERGFKPRDQLHLIHYLGEGYWKYWFDGYFREDSIDSRDYCRSRRDEVLCEIELIAEPQTVWWAKIRTGQGQEGWTRHPEHFGNKDACG